MRTNKTATTKCVLLQHTQRAKRNFSDQNVMRCRPSTLRGLQGNLAQSDRTFRRETLHALSHPRDEIPFYHLDIPLELLLLLHLQSRFLRTTPNGSGWETPPAGVETQRKKRGVTIRGVGLGAEETYRQCRTTAVQKLSPWVRRVPISLCCLMPVWQELMLQHLQQHTVSSIWESRHSISNILCTRIWRSYEY